MPIQLPDARRLADDALHILRLRALRGIELGFSEVDLAQLLGVRHETISRWWTSYCADGLDSLPGGRTGRPLGSGRSLSDPQADRIKELIDNHSPADLGIAHTLWTRHTVRDLIRKAFAIELAERTVGQYLRRWGYTSKKPERHSRKQRPDEVEQWLEETYCVFIIDCTEKLNIPTALSRNLITCTGPYPCPRSQAIARRLATLAGCA